MTIEDGRGKRCELFDEADLDKALARFDELIRARESLRTRPAERTSALLGISRTRNWAAMAEAMSPDMCDDDRRRVANGGVQRGPEHVIANSQNAVALGAETYLAERSLLPGVIGWRSLELVASSAETGRQRRSTRTSSHVVEIGADGSSPHTSRSILRTSLPPSPNSTSDISWAKRPLTPRYGR